MSRWCPLLLRAAWLTVLPTSAQSFLQGEGHLMNVADTVKLELPPKDYDQFENDVVETSDPSFTQACTFVDPVPGMYLGLTLLNSYVSCWTTSLWPRARTPIRFWSPLSATSLVTCGCCGTPWPSRRSKCGLPTSAASFSRTTLMNVSEKVMPATAHDFAVLCFLTTCPLCLMQPRRAWRSRLHCSGTAKTATCPCLKTRPAAPTSMWPATTRP